MRYSYLHISFLLAENFPILVCFSAMLTHIFCYKRRKSLENLFVPFGAKKMVTDGIAAFSLEKWLFSNWLITYLLTNLYLIEFLVPCFSCSIGAPLAILT